MRREKTVGARADLAAKLGFLPDKLAGGAVTRKEGKLAGER
jgi:hypothetical protein